MENISVWKGRIVTVGSITVEQPKSLPANG
jgi:hypothetical protein